MSSQLASLRSYMRGLAMAWGTEDRPAKYETLAHRLGVTITTVGNLMSGLPSKRDTVRTMADHAKLTRAEFLQASGYLPMEEDRQWDREHYPERAGNIALREDDAPADSAKGDLLIRGSVADGRAYQQMKGVANGLLEKFKADYLLEVLGDGGHPLFSHGDVVLVQETSDPKPGQIVLAEVNGQPICKRLNAIVQEASRRLYTLEPATDSDSLAEIDVPIRGVVVGRIVSL